MIQIIAPDRGFAESEELLHDLARRMTGLEDFGDPHYLEGLRVLLRSYDEDVELTEHGRMMSAGMVLVALAGRLVSEAAWAANPGYREVEISAPLVIVGLPRTGTTALHRLLCRDPGNQGLELWLAQNPMPRPARESWNEQPGFQKCLAGLKAQYAASPDMAAIHEMAADEVDECWNLFRQSFSNITYECAAPVTRYAAWWAQCDMTNAYHRWADNLRLIGLEDRGRRWILKDPSHLFALEKLLDEFPDALLVTTHRDPAKSIPSVCSLNASARAPALVAPDDHALGREQLALWERGMARMLAVRERRPERFVDVHFADFVSKPLDVVRRIYERAGGVLEPTHEEAMGRWLAAHPSGGHRYDAARFGLVPDEVRARFTDYIEACEVRLEG